MPSFEKYGILGKAHDRFLTMILKRVLDYSYKKIKKTAHVNKDFASWDEQSKKNKVIISLTSFPKRITEIPNVIETLFEQNHKPDLIILWLAESQFPNRTIPPSLSELEGRGLIINFCDDLKSYKKYYYTMLQFPDSIVVNVDDDGYYPSNMLQNLMQLHELYPDAICANRVHKMVFNNNGKLLPYNQWKHNYKGIKKPSHLLVPTGFGGTLYPPGSLHTDVFNKDLFKELAFYADDLWLKVMAYRKGTKVVTNATFNKDFVTLGQTQKVRLVDQNVANAKNDGQLKSISDFFAIDWSAIKD